jgi:hypothetical protein
MGTKNTIKLKKYLDVIDEFIADGEITPGMLLSITSDNKVTAVISNCYHILVALEDELQGKTIDDAYVTGTPVQVWTCVPGEVAYMLLAAGSGDVAVGTALMASSDGTLVPADSQEVDSDGGDVTPYAYKVIGTCVEAVDAGSSSGEDPVRIKVRIAN